MVIGQPVVSAETGIELTVLDIQRNVQPNNLAAAQGMEFVAVSVQLRSVQPTGAPKQFSINDFQLQNGQGVRYTPDPQADNGRRLQDAQLPENITIEGDLLFHIPLGDAPLFLLWQATGSTQAYTIALQ
ncbi:MAG: DUF4352 domain-containing protein [Caldilineae bacterium]|nr:MAG: DUF4352 domain-containing protein [Caldilineae bacterium]